MPSAGLPVVVHPHFHSRRTGVTRHVEAVLGQCEGHFDARAIGSALAPGLARIRWSELIGLARRGGLIWHAHRNNEMAVGLILRWLGRDVRLVFTRHAAHRPGWLTRLLMRAADRVVSLTEEMARGVGVPSTVIPHGVDFARFAPPPDRTAAWDALGMGGRHGIGVIGRVRSSKGQGDFAAAIAPLLERYPEWRAVLIGAVLPQERPYADHLRALAPTLALVPEQSQIERWYQGLTAVVQPSHSEGFSLVLLEAMASGCCVVAARLPHFPSLIEEGRTGFLYPPGDVDALREILERVLRSPENARRIGAAAAEEARRRFGVEREIAALAELYAKVGGPG